MRLCACDKLHVFAELCVCRFSRRRLFFFLFPPSLCGGCVVLRYIAVCVVAFLCGAAKCWLFVRALSYKRVCLLVMRGKVCVSVM